jgi:hypothetical protein
VFTLPRGEPPAVELETAEAHEAGRNKQGDHG